MKTISTIATALIAALLVLSPALAVSAGSISLNTNSATYSGSQSITISGTANPAPGAGFSALITVTNPAAQQVFQLPAPVDPSAGTFSLTFAAGGSAAWVTGTYSVTASLSGYSTGVTTFQYTCTTCGGTTSGLSLIASATAASPLYAGQTAQVEAWVSWSTGRAASSASFTVWLVSPSGSAAQITTKATPVTGASGAFWWNIPLASSFSDGLYVVILNATATNSGTTYWTYTQTSFTVNSQIANTGALAAVQTAVTGLGNSLSTLATSVGNLQSGLNSLSGTVGTINSNVNSLSSAVAALNTAVTGSLQTANSALTSIQGSITGLSTQVQAAATAANSASTAATAAQASAKSASDAVSSTQTYVLVVAAIAAITLVLELAILVRKLS